MILATSTKGVTSAGLALLFGMVSMQAAAQSNVTLYGRLDTSIESQKQGAVSVSQMTDNASRWGMRGTEDLGGGLKAAFGLEYGYGVDTGIATTPQFRHSYVGLSSLSYGNLAIGRLDSATIAGSPIYSQITRNVSFVIHDAGATAIGTKIFNARNRVSNSVGYMSPSWQGLTLLARVNLAGPDPATPLAPTPVKSEGDFRQYDTGLLYKLGNFGAGLGYSKDSKKGGLLTNNFDSKLQAVASYQWSPVTVYAAYGRDRYVGTATTRSDVDYWLTGASFESGAHKVMANYAQREVQTDVQGRLRKFQIGYRYQLSKRTMPYVYFDREDPNSQVSGDVIRTVGLGIQHTF